LENRKIVAAERSGSENRHWSKRVPLNSAEAKLQFKNVQLMKAPSDHLAPDQDEALKLQDSNWHPDPKD
jgi:hypothetical protein